MGLGWTQKYIHGLNLRTGPRSKKNLEILKERFPDINIIVFDYRTYIAIEEICTGDEDSHDLADLHTCHFNPQYESSEREGRLDIEYVLGRPIILTEIDSSLLEALNELGLYTSNSKYYHHHISHQID